jgi:hypothetical protein
MMFDNLSGEGYDAMREALALNGFRLARDFSADLELNDDIAYMIGEFLLDTLKRECDPGADYDLTEKGLVIECLLDAILGE